MTTIDEYVEIIHLNPKLQEITIGYKGCGEAEKEIIRRIRSIEKERTHYIDRSIRGNFPKIPKNTPIRIGGAMWEEGVQLRARLLIRAGYEKVTADRSISLSYEDFPQLSK
jgi:hypothetical protein